jgi:predicted nucleic acid-binding protein
VARHWLEQAIDASATGRALTAMPMVLARFMRLVTSQKIFRVATPIEDAVAFVDALLALPGVHLAALGLEWTKLRQICLDKQQTGNDLPGVWLAAAGSHPGQYLVSFDRDFRKLLARSHFTLPVPG